MIQKNSMTIKNESHSSKSYYEKFLEPPSNLPFLKEDANIENGINPSHYSQHGLKIAIKSIYPILLAKQASEKQIISCIQEIILNSYFLKKETVKELIPEDWLYILE
jgi:hypothetical protein